MPATAPAATPAESPETGAEGIDAEGAGALTEPAPVVGFALAGAVPARYECAALPTELQKHIREK